MKYVGGWAFTKKDFMPCHDVTLNISTIKSLRFQEGDYFFPYVHVLAPVDRGNLHPRPMCTSWIIPSGMVSGVCFPFKLLLLLSIEYFESFFFLQLWNVFQSMYCRKVRISLRIVIFLAFLLQCGCITFTADTCSISFSCNINRQLLQLLISISPFYENRTKLLQQWYWH